MSDRTTDRDPARGIEMFTLYAMTPKPATPGKHHGIDLVTVGKSGNRTSPCLLGYEVRRRSQSDEGSITRTGS